MAWDEGFLDPEAQRYVESRIALPLPVMQDIEAETRTEGWAIGRQAGGLLRALCLARGATRALDVGTNRGFSALWMGSGLAPGGTVEGIELDAAYATRARQALGAAFPGRATVHEAAALDVMPTLPDRAYDVIFLDAVKSEYPRYLDHALRLLKPGGVVAADNMLWRGEVWDAKKDDADVRGIREYTRRALSDPRLASTLVPVEDGMMVSVLAR